MASRSIIWFITALAILCVACQKTQSPATGDSAGPINPPDLQADGNELEDPSIAEAQPVAEYVFCVYAGSYSTLSEAMAIAEELRQVGFAGEAVDAGQEYFVLIGRVYDFERARLLQDKLQSNGYPEAFTTRSIRDTSVSTGAAAAATNVPPEDTQARDPQLWINELGDPGCLLMTEEECRALLKVNPEKRCEFTLELNNCQDTMARMRHTVYVGSFRDRDQAELAAAQAGRSGILLDVQPDAAGGWIASAPACDNNAAAGTLRRQLAAAGLENTARMKPSAELQQRIADLQAALRMLDEQDEIAKVCLKQYGY